jgi:hypothetical protein
LHNNDEVYKACEKALRDYGMLFNKLRHIIQARSWQIVLAHCSLHNEKRTGPKLWDSPIARVRKAKPRAMPR